MTLTVARSWALALAVTAVGTLSFVSGCVSEEDPGDGTGGKGTGGGGGASGSTGMTGGSGGGGGTSGGDPLAVACPTPTTALMTDFSMPNPDGKGVSFGDFTMTFSGSTFQYPDKLVADFTKGGWNVSGMVDNYAGLGIALQKGADACTKFDASAFKGISFTVSGSVPGGTGSVNSVEFWLQTAANDVTSAFLNMYKDAGAKDVHNFGRCTPVMMAAGGQYDGTCKDFRKTVMVTATPTPVTLNWADLTGGKPAASLTLSELVAFGITLPNPAGVGSAAVTPYAIDITIDDLKFIE